MERNTPPPPTEGATVDDMANSLSCVSLQRERCELCQQSDEVKNLVKFDYTDVPVYYHDACMEGFSNKHHEECEICIICRESVPLHGLVKLSCGHHYHPVCLSEWWSSRDPLTEFQQTLAVWQENPHQHPNPLNAILQRYPILERSLKCCYCSRTVTGFTCLSSCGEPKPHGASWTISRQDYQRKLDEADKFAHEPPSNRRCKECTKKRKRDIISVLCLPWKTHWKPLTIRTLLSLSEQQDYDSVTWLSNVPKRPGEWVRHNLATSSTGNRAPPAIITFAIAIDKCWFRTALTHPGTMRDFFTLPIPELEESAVKLTRLLFSIEQKLFQYTHIMHVVNEKVDCVEKAEIYLRNTDPIEEQHTIKTLWETVQQEVMMLQAKLHVWKREQTADRPTSFRWVSLAEPVQPMDWTFG